MWDPSFLRMTCTVFYVTLSVVKDLTDVETKAEVEAEVEAKVEIEI